MGRGRPPRVTKKPLVSEHEFKKQHKERVNKMKQLYGIGANPNSISGPHPDTLDQEFEKHRNDGKVFEYPKNPKDRLPLENNDYQNHPIQNSKHEEIKQSPMQIPKIQKIVKAPEQKSTGASLYSFYQNIIDRNSEANPEVKHTDKLSHPNYQVHSKIVNLFYTVYVLS